LTYLIRNFIFKAVKPADN